MARMIPADLPHDKTPESEIEVYRALKSQFDDTWTVFHSYTSLGRNRDDKLVDTEIDFLLLHPQHGILVLEVKGGKIGLENGCWYGVDHKRAIDPPPPVQAKRNRYHIEGRVEARLGFNPPVCFGYAMCFPDCFEEFEELPLDERGLIINGHHLRHLDTAVRHVMDNWDRRAERSVVPQKILDDIIQVLVPMFEYGVSLTGRLSREARTMFRLTEEQCKCLGFLGKQKKALIQGCAGSGKTIMAVKKARQLAVDGKSVLLICYNQMLGDRLKLEVEDVSAHVTAGTFEDYYWGLKGVDKLTIDRSALSQGFWNQELPEELSLLAAEQGIQYDALIVDEGQDFRSEYWIALDDLLVEDGLFYVFYDSDQNIFAGNGGGEEVSNLLSDLGVPFLLDTNCRNTGAIVDQMQPYCSRKIELNEDAPQGAPVEQFLEENSLQRKKCLSRLLHRLVEEEGVSEEKIVILGGHRLENTCVGDDHQAGAFRIVQDGESGSKKIAYHTYFKFKGCESEVVILLDVDPSDPNWADDRAMYTAMSRAKHMLFVLYKKGHLNSVH